MLVNVDQGERLEKVSTGIACDKYCAVASTHDCIYVQQMLINTRQEVRSSKRNEASLLTTASCCTLRRTTLYYTMPQIRVKSDPHSALTGLVHSLYPLTDADA